MIILFVYTFLHFLFVIVPWTIVRFEILLFWRNVSLNYYVIFGIQYKRHSKLVYIYNATLGDKFNIMVLLHHIIVYYITKLHYSRLLYLFTSWLFIWNCFLLFCFYFHFYSSISFLFTLQILFDLMLHWMFYLVFVLLYLLSFYVIIYPA